jgi:uncharacterized membrane protein
MISNFDSFYRALAALGYSHPLHPPFTHMTIGLVVAALIFRLAGLLWRRPLLDISARHCQFLAWLFLFPTVIFGFTDWLHYYRGAWIFAIEAKLALAAGLLVLQTAALILEWRHLRGDSKTVLLIYFLSFFMVAGLGYLGGNLVFGGAARPKAAQPGEESLQVGKLLFISHCRACHPAGGNIILPQHPLQGSERLADFDTFLHFVRDPRLDDGAKGPMPGYPPPELSDPQARELYAYLFLKFGPLPGAAPPHQP